MTVDDVTNQGFFPGLPSLDDLPLSHLSALAYEASRAVVRRLSAQDISGELSPAAPPTADSGSTDWGSMLDSADEPEHVSVPETGFSPNGLGPREVGQERFTLSALQHAVEDMGRMVTAAQMAVARHTAESFANPVERRRLLGLPEGKTPFRDAADFLKLSLRISGTEARRRTRWAETLCPKRTLAGELLPPPLPELSKAVHEGELDAAAVDVIASTLSKARQMADRVEADPQAVAELVDGGERRLVQQGQSVDPGILRKVADHWLKWFEAAVDPDGPEPSDAHVPQIQGLIRKGKKNGLYHWLLSVDDKQNELIETIAGAATNPRSAFPSGDKDNLCDGSVDDALTAEVVSEGDGSIMPVPAVDPRSRNQRQLDGLISCLSGGLAIAGSDSLPASGGTRPQIAVTIDFRTLMGSLVAAGLAGADDLRQFESSAAFSGTIHPNVIRTMACDGDILPVVLGSDGEILDVGRSQRLFPPRMRRAIAARDGGCTAPGCWIPAPWCDVHHVQYWEHGGPTSTDNGVLLCNHHHHAVHAGAWQIDMRSGRPWFIPAPYLDPRQQPQRNRYWRE